MYSTLALGKEREIVKEETALRKEYKDAYNCIYCIYTCTNAASFSFLKAVSSFTISLSFPNASVLYAYFPCMNMYSEAPHIAIVLWNNLCTELALSSEVQNVV